MKHFILKQVNTKNTDNFPKTVLQDEFFKNTFNPIYYTRAIVTNSAWVNFFKYIFCNFNSVAF